MNPHKTTNARHARPLPPLRTLYLAACLAAAQGAGAAPQGANVVFGQAQVQAGGLAIQQGSNKAVIDWNSFSIASGETLRIAQPGANAVLLNRVVGVDPSLILGRIEANGRVFLSNPRGIVLGAGSVIDTGSFLATTLKIDTQDFLADRLQLRADADAGADSGVLRADGEINALGGTIALVAPQLSVSGTLTARRIGLAAASSVRVDVEGDGLIFFDARNDGLQARLDMLGKLRADGGTAELRAQARAGFADTVLNMDGIVQARSLGLRNGRVVIDGGSEGMTVVAGQVDVSGGAAGERGGSATLLGHQLALVGTATVDASGAAGGGEIRVGGGFHGQGTERNAEQSYLGARTLLKADALISGDGGNIAVWSDGATRYFGQLSARGGAQGGNGGFAEVSGRQFLDFSGTADLRAPRGARGRLLLDPQDLTIGTVADLDGTGPTVPPEDNDLAAATLFFDAQPGVDSQIRASTVSALLETADVTLEATRDIFVQSGIAPAAAPTPRSLTLRAGNNITVNANIAVADNLTLAANSSFASSPASGTGALIFGAAVELSGKDVILSGTGNLTLPKITAAGKITATTSGSIDQEAGTAFSVGAAGSRFESSGTGQTIALTGANVFNGFDVSFASLGAAGDVSISGDALHLAASTIGGKLVATANTGGITQGAAFSVGADGNRFETVANDQAITLNETNLFNGTDVIFFTHGGQPATVQITGDALKFAGSTIAGHLIATASTGGISQTGALDIASHGSVLSTSTADQTIVLTQANVFNDKTIAFNTSGTGGDVTYNATLINFGASTIGGKLVATASNGTISQAGAISVGADGSRFETQANDQAITLTAANVFNGKDVYFRTNGGQPANVEITGDALKFAGSLIAGHLIATASTGGISQTGALDIASHGSVLTTSTADQTILLTQANVFNDKTIAFNTSGTGGDVTYNATLINFGASTIGGKLVATASNGTISQAGALNLGADGSSFTTSNAGQAITLSDTGNVFNGKTLAFSSNGSGADVTVTGDGLRFAASTVGGKLVATALTGSISQTGVLNLGADGSDFTTSTGGQAVELSLANVLNGNDVAFHSGGNTTFTSAGAIELAATATGGSLALTANSGAITQSAAFSVGGNGNSFSAASISLGLGNTINAFDVALTSAGNVTFNGNALRLAASTIGGTLSSTASAGSITQGGALSIGTAGSSFTAQGSGNSIDLGAFDNSIAGLAAGNVSFSAPRDLSVRNLAGIQVPAGAASLGGKLELVSVNGSITQGGTAFSVGADGSRFSGQTVTLGQAGNNFNGHDVALVTTVGDAVINATALDFAGSTLAGKLTATASTGAITQSSGVLSLGANGSDFIASNGAVTLTRANLLNGHTVALHAAGDASLTSAGGIALLASTVGGKLSATANTGDLTQTAAFSVGADGNSFTATTGAIQLNQANVLAGKTVSLNSGGAATLNSNGPVVLAAGTVGGALAVTAASGSITQAVGAGFSIGGNSSFSASGGAITLDRANSFNGFAVALTSGGDATVSGADALKLAASTVGGKLTASTASGDITQTGAFSVGANGSVFTADAGAITLQSANQLGGNNIAFHSSGNTAFTSAGPIVLAASTAGGSLAASAQSGGITQTGVLSVGADGSSFSGTAVNLSLANTLNGHSVALSTSAGNALLTSSNGFQLGTSNIAGSLTAVGGSGSIGQTGVLTVSADSSFNAASLALTQANIFNGSAVTLTSTGDAAFRADAVKLAASTIGGKLTATASTGAITQTGAFSVNADGSDFITSGANQAITLTQANVLNGRTVALHSTGNASLSAGAIRLAASTVGGSLALASSGAITQSGALSVGADGSTVSGTTIALTQANVLGGKTIALTSTGDAAISGDALRLAASTIGGKLTASASGALSQSGAFSVALDGSHFSGNTVNLSLANVFNGRDVKLTSTGDAALGGDALKFAASTVGGKLTASTAGAVTQTGALSLGADGSHITGQSITLTGANIFNGKSLGLTSTNDAALSGDALKLAASSIGGKLSATATTGAITQTGALSIGASGSSFTTSGASQAITLDQANVLGLHTVALHSSGDATLTADTINLAASTVGGKLVATATSGGIWQTAAFSVGADGSDFITTANGITLNQFNNLNGKSVAFHTAGDAGLTATGDVVLGASTVANALSITALNGSISQVGAISTGMAGSVFNVAGAGHGVNLSTHANTLAGLASGTDQFITSGDLALRNVGNIRTASFLTVPGKLVLISDTGTISQAFGFSVGADGSHFSGTTVTLDKSNALNGHTISLSSTGDALLSADAIKLAASTIGGKLTATATAGAITQTGAFSVGADGSAFSGQSLALTQANVLNGKTVALSSTGDAALSSADAIKLATSTIGGKLVLATPGALTQTGAFSVGADGSSFSAQTLTLQGANAFNFKTVALNTSGDATLTGNSLKFATSSVGGKLHALSTTSITQTGALTLGADGSYFGGQSVTLTQNNVFNGKTISASGSGDAAITADSLVLGSVAMGGKLTATATSGGITQTAAFSVGADGSDFITGAGQSVVLSQAGNNLNGKSIAFHSGGDATLASSGAINFAASTVGGKLSASTTGAITQSAALSLGADGSAFSGQSIALTQANVLGGKSVALTSTGDAALNGDAIKLAASTVGGKLSATATGAITQTGALSVGADGSAFSGQTIALTQANLLNGKTVTLTSSGDAALNADAIKLAASTFGGKLSAAATGAITQTGALSVGADGNSLSGQTITLTQANLLNGKTVALTSSGDAALNADAIALAASTVGGKLSATATGAITQTGALSVGADGSSFSGQTIALTQANALNGKTVALTSSGSAALKADAIKLAASTVGGALTLQADTAITQSGVLAVGGLTTLTATGSAGTLTLADAGNSFGGGLQLAQSAGAGWLAATVSGAGTLSVGGDAGQLNLAGTGPLVLTGGRYGTLSLAIGQGISQTGAIAVDGLLSLTATGASPVAVDLATSAGNELKQVTLAATGPGFATVRLADADTRADGLSVAGSAAALNLAAQGGVTLAGGQYGSLSVTAAGIQQSGAVQVSGLTTLDAGSSDITLNLAANDFATLALLGAAKASLADANDLTLSQAQTSGDLTLSVPGTVQFSGGYTGTGALIKQGTGTLLVTSALANLGGTQLQGGLLVLAGPAASLGAGTLALGAASTLELRDGAVLANALVAQGGLILASSGGSRMDGALTLAADTTLDVAAGASLRLGGALSETGGARALSKAGAGQLQLSGSDSRSGATRIDQGVLLADGTLSAASAHTVGAGATLRLGGDQSIGSLAGAGAVELGAHQLSAGADQSSTTFSGSLSGSGALTKTGTGTLTLAGLNTQTGATRVQSGALALAGGQAQANTTALQLAAGAELILAADETLGGLSGAGTVTLANQRLSLDTAGQDAAFSGAINGGAGGAISKRGSGTQTLSGTGSWGGETRVDGGRLQLASATALPMGKDVAVAAGATLALRDALTLRALAGAGTVLVDNAALLSVGAADGSSQFAGSLQGSGGLAKIGSGTLTLSGANTFTGAVSVQGGTLVLAGGSALADTAQLALAGGATLRLQAGETFARLSGTGQVQLDNAARLSLGNDGADTRFAGSLAGNGSLAKQGAGTLILAGNNSHTGGTLVEAGTLQVGDGGTAGSLGSGAVDNRGLLRFARSGDSSLDNAVSGSGALEQTLGKLTITSSANSYTGATTVTAGSLATSGAERLPDASALKVAAGASLTLAGNETLGSLAADGMVTVEGNVSTTGAQRYGAGLTISAPAGITLQAGGAIEATHAANAFGTQPLSLRADSVQLSSPQDLTLGTVQLAQGGLISAERLRLQGALTLNGGTLRLTARAAPDDAKAQAPNGATTTLLPGTDKSLALAEATLVQAEGSSITVAAGATLNATALGSIDFHQTANQITGGIALLSGAAYDTAWTPNVKTTTGIQSQIRLAGQTINLTGAGIEADLVEISAAKLATLDGSQITARLPYDNVASGTTLSIPGLKLNLLPGAFDAGFSFGSSGDGGIRVVVGARETGNRTEGPDSGYLTVLPVGGAQGSTAIFLLGPAAGSGLGYSLFHDGAGKASEVPVFYNNVLPAVPQLTSALSSVTAVSESARRDRFEEAVRTENVTVRLRAGVIAEVGPGRAATTGSGGVQAPPQCETLDCAP